MASHHQNNVFPINLHRQADTTPWTQPEAYPIHDPAGRYLRSRIRKPLGERLVAWVRRRLFAIGVAIYCVIVFTVCLFLFQFARGL